MPKAYARGGLIWTRLWYNTLLSVLDRGLKLVVRSSSRVPTDAPRVVRPARALWIRGGLGMTLPCSTNSSRFCDCSICACDCPFRICDCSIRFSDWSVPAGAPRVVRPAGALRIRGTGHYRAPHQNPLASVTVLFAHVTVLSASVTILFASVTILSASLTGQSRQVHLAWRDLREPSSETGGGHDPAMLLKLLAAAGTPLNPNPQIRNPKPET